MRPLSGGKVHPVPLLELIHKGAQLKRELNLAVKTDTVEPSNLSPATQLPVLDAFFLQLHSPSQCGGYGNDFPGLWEQEMRGHSLSKLSRVLHVTQDCIAVF